MAYFSSARCILLLPDGEPRYTHLRFNVSRLESSQVNCHVFGGQRAARTCLKVPRVCDAAVAEMALRYRDVHTVASFEERKSSNFYTSTPINAGVISRGQASPRSTNVTNPGLNLGQEEQYK